MDPVEVGGGYAPSMSRITAGEVPFGRAVERHSASKVVVLGGGDEGLIDAARAAWNVQPNVTVALVPGLTGDANELTVAGVFTTGLIASKDIALKDLSGYAHIRALIKSSVALAAGVLQIGVSETAGMLGSPNWSNVPALVAGVPKLISVAFVGAVSTRNATLSVGLNAVSDPGACIITVEQVSAGAEFNGIDGIIDDKYVEAVYLGSPTEKYPSGRDARVFTGGLLRPFLETGITCVANQRLYPVPGGKFTTTMVDVPGRTIIAKEDQITAGSQVVAQLV